jgi:peroxiredoxin Q/BCP
MGINRTTFLINPEGNVACVFEKVNPAGHGVEVLAKLKELSR